jgi:putative lipoprotein (rSAM/lipoprotein system)
MKTNRKKIIKRINLVLVGVISMLGFAGCETEGTPYVNYTVKGKVVNKADGKPIKGIRVGYSPELFWAIPMYGVIPTPYQPKKHVLTDAKGEFELTDRFNAEEYQIVDGQPILPVSVEDIDGEENGLFQPEYLQVNFSNAEHSGIFQYTKTLNVELTETNNP